MRGTILRLRSHNFNSCSSDNDSGGEETQDKPAYDEQNSSTIPDATSCADVQSQDTNKNVLLSNLELCRTSVCSEADGHIINNNAPPFQRTVFDWNDESMWKAMSRHPLFSKYMELQSQLHSLFEEIRLDCKKAACEKALASLIKNTEDSPMQATPIAVLPRVSVETQPKKKGRPIKKKPGRPRKDESTVSTQDWNNITTPPANKHPRKCREELFLTRKPSWICQNCAKRFSSSGWLDRHKSVCPFSNRLSLDQIEGAVENSHNVNTSSLPGNDTQPLENFADRTYSVSRLSDTSVSLSPSRLRSQFKVQEETPESQSLLPFHSHISPVIPLKPKMENHNGDDDEALRKHSFNEDCTDTETFVTTCGKCKQKFAAPSHFMRHLEEYPECKVYACPPDSDKDSGEYSSDTSVSACKHCGKTFRKEKFLKRHQSMCHVKSKKKLYQCSNCFKAFRRQSHHEQHQRDCLSKGARVVKETQRCENCSLLFATQKKLLKHQAICCPDSTNHMVKLLKCLKCSMVFPTYKKQLKHRAVCCPDSDTKAMVCRYCSKVLIMKDRMEAHKKKCYKLLKAASN